MTVLHREIEWLSEIIASEQIVELLLGRSAATAFHSSCLPVYLSRTWLNSPMAPFSQWALSAGAAQLVRWLIFCAIEAQNTQQVYSLSSSSSTSALLCRSMRWLRDCCLNIKPSPMVSVQVRNTQPTAGHQSASSLCYPLLTWAYFCPLSVSMRANY